MKKPLTAILFILVFQNPQFSSFASANIIEVIASDLSFSRAKCKGDERQRLSEFKKFLTRMISSACLKSKSLNYSASRSDGMRMKSDPA